MGSLPLNLFLKLLSLFKLFHLVLYFIILCFYSKCFILCYERCYIKLYIIIYVFQKFSDETWWFTFVDYKRQRQPCLIYILFSWLFPTFPESLWTSPRVVCLWKKMPTSTVCFTLQEKVKKKHQHTPCYWLIFTKVNEGDWGWSASCNAFWPWSGLEAAVRGETGMCDGVLSG